MIQKCWNTHKKN